MFFVYTKLLNAGIKLYCAFSRFDNIFGELRGEIQSLTEPFYITII